jgi:hypothetical protein
VYKYASRSFADETEDLRDPSDDAIDDALDEVGVDDISGFDDGLLVLVVEVVVVVVDRRG